MLEVVEIAVLIPALFALIAVVGGGSCDFIRLPRRLGAPSATATKAEGPPLTRRPLLGFVQPAADLARSIGDFTRWKEHDAYQKAPDRLLRDLRVERA
jgi:hypothetical protein